MVALADGKPQTLGLKAILGYYLKHQRDVVTRRTQKDLETARKRFHIVEGFIKAIGIMDEIIKLIRASKSKKDASDNLREKFGFTEIQAEAILELMLYRLTGLEITAFEKEHRELEKIIKKLTKILEDDKELLKIIKTELTEVRDKFGDPRKTKIVEDDEEAKIDIEEIIPFEDVIVTLSNEGFIKRVPLKTYNRSNVDIEDIEHREGDFNRFLLNSNTKDTIMVFTDSGNMYQLKGANIPEQKWRDKGERMDMLIKGIDLNQERIVEAFSIESTSLQKDFMFFTNTGCIKKSGLDKFSTNYSKLMALKLKDDEKLISVKLVDVEREEKFIKFTTELGMEFTIEEPRLESADRNIASMQLVTTSSGNRLTDAKFSDEYNYRNFFVNIGKDGILRTGDSKDSKSSFTEACNSSSSLFMFQNDGIVLSIPAFMIQNIGERGVEISKIFDGIDFRRIIKAFCIDDFSADKYFCFISAKGIVKKTALNDFQGDAMTSTACKFKTEQDNLVGVELAGIDYDLLIITKKGMSILFSLESVNPMGRIASGVTAISLNEDDQVIYELVAESITDKPGSIKLTSKKGQEAEIKLADFRRQNRAGKGRNVCLIVFEDFIKDIKYKSR